MLTGCSNYCRRNNYMQKHPNVSLEYKRCNFWVILYLTRVLKKDPKKIKAIKEWKFPTTIKQLQGFLGLIGYYWNFVNNYGRIATPLTKLLKKDAFSWTLEATKAFEHLKEAMCLTPVLATQNFTKTFIVECDASGNM